MIPTNYLRWLREPRTSVKPDNLQQWWSENGEKEGALIQRKEADENWVDEVCGEWRNVPVVMDAI